MNRPTWRLLYGMMGLSFLWRLYISYRTPIPSEDGVNYLWMAERFAQGELALGLSEVFPPLFSLITAIPIALGMDPFPAAQLVLNLAGVLAIIPIARATEILVPGGGPCAGCLLAFASRPIKLAAEVYTEPLFLLATALGILAGLNRRWWILGLWSGVGFWLRPEALVLPVAFLFANRAAWRSLIPAVSLTLALTLWRQALGQGFDPIPKIGIIHELDVTQTGSIFDSITRFLTHLVQIPWLSVEAFGPMLFLALLGLIKRKPGMLPLYWTLALGIAVICAYLPRWRFLVSWTVPVVPIAVAGYHALPKPSRAPVLALIVLFGLIASLRTTDPNRIAERRVGEYLAERLQPAERVIGDMTRVIYYCGRRPLAPRRISEEDREEMIATARQPDVRYVILAVRRQEPEQIGAINGSLRDEFTTLQFPPEIQALADDRGILVLERQ